MRQGDRPPLQLHEFLRSERDAILRDWERIDRQNLDSAQDLSNEELRNNVPMILDAIAEYAEKVSRSGTGAVPREGPKGHAEQRWQLGISLEEVTREYGFLRTVILQKLVPRVGELSAKELVLLNEALDQAIIEAVTTYVASANQALVDERQRLQVTLSSIGEGVVSTDPEGRITYLNPAAEEMSDWSQDEVVGQPVADILITVDEETRRPLQSLTQVAVDDNRLSQRPAAVLLQRRDGGLLAVEEVAAPLRDASGEFLGAVMTFRDVSKIRALTLELGYLATHDPLTGLPNRTLLLDRLSQELAHAERHRTRLAVLYLDLDLFKNVNDVFGHSAGDRLLKQVAQRLQQCVRRTDTVGRMSGDEFAILLTEFAPIAYLNELSEKIAQQLGAPYDIGRETVTMSTSVGISVYPEDGRDAETLVKHADMAMYRAKARGRNAVQFFAPEMSRQADERRNLQNDLSQAIATDQLSLRFQPQISLRTGRILGAEALLRWNHPLQGLISPSRFIPMAEGNREIMVAVGDWVLEHACRQARIWLDAGYAPVRISVNISVVQLRNENFLQHVAETLNRFRLPADNLQFELTESLLMGDDLGVVDCIRALKSLGVRIAVDDFGTGYSSLNHLKKLPVDELKIDNSFIHDIDTNPDDGAIAQAIIRMGQSLKLRVIAEGVENRHTVDFLAANDCEGAQGYYYSEAIEPDQFEHSFLSANVRP